MLDITGIKCPKCKAIIFSRARHDFRQCLCEHENIYIDGGFEYMRIGYTTDIPTTVRFSLDVTKEELYNDWNYHRDIFGCIKEEDQTMEITEIRE